MNDHDYTAREKQVRDDAAAAFTYERPEAAKKPAFTHFVFDDVGGPRGGDPRDTPIKPRLGSDER